MVYMLNGRFFLCPNSCKQSALDTNSVFTLDRARKDYPFFAVSTKGGRDGVTQYLAFIGQQIKSLNICGSQNDLSL